MTYFTWCNNGEAALGENSSLSLSWVAVPFFDVLCVDDCESIADDFPPVVAGDVLLISTFFLFGVTTFSAGDLLTVFTAALPVPFAKLEKKIINL